MGSEPGAAPRAGVAAATCGPLAGTATMVARSSAGWRPLMNASAGSTLAWDGSADDESRYASLPMPSGSRPGRT